MQESFETLAECKKRFANNNVVEITPHDHCGNLNKWDLTECVQEISALPDKSFLNFSQLAKK